ncbi:thiamine phosphate synthase [Paenibacillus sp. DCT19]|uniref:thiamine phosphate synthase n=1 Tax=Paenibacillus sp. DCT19 TaxID=2211212 RepID=UPI0013E3F7CC|nr:thiamine phosphate synthase [Paenibacillus sp. DCT19]
MGQGEGLAGVHWGQEDFSKSALSISDIRKRIRIGVSVHSVAEAKAAEQRGVDYVFFGHIYDSNSKPDIQPRGLKQLAEVCTNVTIPVIAIGGIGLSTFVTFAELEQEALLSYHISGRVRIQSMRFVY